MFRLLHHSALRWDLREGKEYECSSIIKYLDPSTRDLFTVHFAHCHFNESFFSILGGETKQLTKEICWNELPLSHLDHCIKQYDYEIQKIIH